LRARGPSRRNECGTWFRTPLLSFLANVLAGGCRAPKFPAAAPLWRRTFGILSSPRPRWVAEHMRRPTGRMFFTVLKDICSLGQSYLCVSAVSPPGTHRGRGCVNSPTTPRNTLWSADFRATSSPPLWREGTREPQQDLCTLSDSYRTHVFLGVKKYKNK
jgi:hypothetical protein